MADPAASFIVYRNVGRIRAMIASWDTLIQQVSRMRARDVTANMRALEAEVSPILAGMVNESDFHFVASQEAMAGLEELAARFGWSITDAELP